MIEEADVEGRLGFIYLLWSKGSESLLEIKLQIRTHRSSRSLGMNPSMFITVYLSLYNFNFAKVSFETMSSSFFGSYFVNS